MGRAGGARLQDAVRGIGFYLFGTAARDSYLLPSLLLTLPRPPSRGIPSGFALQLPFEFADFMGHLRRLMKELYEAGFCFKECTRLRR